jgi:ABC-type bacteriocin/lantibiotic exporter with double-glycine peptidase domain
MIMFSSLFEALSVIAVVPFLGALTKSDEILSFPPIRYLIQLLDVSSDVEIVRVIAFAFIILIIITAITRLFLLWYTIKITNAIGADLSEDIYRRTLYQPYLIHTKRNSSEILDGITRKVTALMNGAVSPIFSILTTSSILLSMLITLVYFKMLSALITLAGFATVYLVIMAISKNFLKRNGDIIAKESIQVVKALQEGLGGIRDVLIDGSQELYCKIYANADRPYRLAAGKNAFINASPRFLVESLGMTIIAILALWFGAGEAGIQNSIPILGAIALGAQKSLPLLQNFFGAWASIKGNQASVSDALELLKQPLPYSLKSSGAPFLKMDFTKIIELKNLSFKYSEKDQFGLTDINLSIPKGAKVGLIGKTGTGKSSLCDILMGLIQPTAGSLEIDGVSIHQGNAIEWQRNIAHVPQFIFLTDASIEENIAFGVKINEINFENVIRCARLAQIHDSIEEMPYKYRTVIGERGVRLSGGQRQRIGIARALYKQASVIFFDEATSALDGVTEKSLMDAVYSLSKDLTLIIVAHRLSTLRYCDFIIELSNGSIQRVDSYKNLSEEGRKR